MESRLLRSELPEDPWEIDYFFARITSSETETALHLVDLLEQDDWEDDTYYDINVPESYFLIATPFKEGIYLEEMDDEANFREIEGVIGYRIKRTENTFGKILAERVYSDDTEILTLKSDNLYDAIVELNELISEQDT